MNKLMGSLFAGFLSLSVFAQGTAPAAPSVPPKMEKKQAKSHDKTKASPNLAAKKPTARK